MSRAHAKWLVVLLLSVGCDRSSSDAGAESADDEDSGDSGSSAASSEEESSSSESESEEASSSSESESEDEGETTTGGTTESSEGDDETTSSSSSTTGDDETTSEASTTSGSDTSGEDSGEGEDSSEGGSPDDDLDMTAEMFECFEDWDRMDNKARITNLLGNLPDALEVAANPAGGVYPVGTVIQHIPTEAMVKRRAGFSAASKDWEFFVLDVADGTTEIVRRGADISTNQGQTCISCHSNAGDEWDFVCSDDAAACGGPFPDSFFNMQDPRCP